jgi:hypothetical protein
MQSPLSDVLTWKNAVLTAVVAAISSIATYLLKRKQLPSQIHKTDAEAALSQAQADDLDLRGEMSAAQMIREMTRYTVQLELEKAHLKEQLKVVEGQLQIFKAQRTLDRLDH